MNYIKQLAIYGGEPIRKKEFKSKPYITEEMKQAVIDLMEIGRFSKFIGSPIPGTNEILGMQSSDAAKLGDITSFLGGESVRTFEALWAEIHQCKYAISVNSATSGITTAVLGINLEPGCEVICTPFSFTASATAIIAANVIPTFADIDLDTFCLSPESVMENLSENTKCIMPVHWNSNAGHLDEIINIAERKNLLVLEDAAQAPGSIYKNNFLGTHGNIGVFSLNEPKNIMTGEGGMIVTNDEETAIKCRLIRNHGEAIVDENYSDKMASNIVGFNFRLVEILAELGKYQLLELTKLNEIRRKNYLFLINELQKVIGNFLIPQKITNMDSYYPYTAGFRWLSEKSGIHRNTVAAVLRTEGIPVASGVSRLMSDNPLFKRKIAFGVNQCPFSCHLNPLRNNYSIPELPNANRLQDHEYLGFFQLGWPNTEEDMLDIVKGFKKILDNKYKLCNENNSQIKSEFISGR